MTCTEAALTGNRFRLTRVVPVSLEESDDPETLISTEYLAVDEYYLVASRVWDTQTTKDALRVRLMRMFGPGRVVITHAMGRYSHRNMAYVSIVAGYHVPTGWREA